MAYTILEPGKQIPMSKVKVGKISAVKWEEVGEEGAKPQITATYKGEPLTEGTDYTVSYKKNKTVGEKATLTVKGKGNYGKTTPLEFAVTQKNVEIYKNSVSVNAVDKVYSDTKSVWKPSFKVYDEDGKALGKMDMESVEYRISYLPKTETESSLKVGDELDLQTHKTAILPIGTKVKIKVTLTGNYKGIVEGSYRILTPGYDISKAVIKIDAQTYTGNTYPKPVSVCRRKYIYQK